MRSTTSVPPATAALAATPLAQRLLAAFPLVLFLPQGVVNASLAIYLVVLLFAGDWRQRLALLRQHPLLAPALGMLILCVLNGLLLERSADFASGFVHYQDYLFLFLFMAAGPGAWQQQAVRNFFVGATIAAALLFLARASLLPKWGVLSAYTFYGGNKSILLGLLLALAACWMLAQLLQAGRRDWKAILRFVFVALAVVLVAKSRTGQLILVLGCSGVLLWSMRNWRQRLISLLGVVLLAALAVQAVPQVSTRLVGTTADLRAFVSGGTVSGDGERLEIFRATAGLIAEKPLAGHGIGAWFPYYKERIQGTVAPLHSTPHNDYLLYLTELGLPGLLLLLWTLWTQVALCRRLPTSTALQMGTLTLALMVGAMFNAMLRDFVFAFPFMFLLAVLVTGLRRQKAEP